MRYPLERLFTDQDHDWVADAIAPVLAWVPGRSRAKASPPFRFPLEVTGCGRVDRRAVDLTWDEQALASRVPGVLDHAGRLRAGRSVQREHVTELAAYGLSLVAISIVWPGRRIQAFSIGVAPDILFDLTPNALRGVESAGRATGGRRALVVVRNGTKTQRGKHAQLAARTDLAEVHLSLWSASARHGMMEQVLP